MASRVQQLYAHASHPNHKFMRFAPPLPPMLCSVCKASSNDSEVSWYRCNEESCGYVMCQKCFEVDETLFTSLQVVVRNPMLPHDELRACVHTRPRESSYVLAPIYAGTLIEVVSSSQSKEVPDQRFFRVRSGGWIDSSCVVSVLPADPSIERLTRYHLQMYNLEAASEQLSESEYQQQRLSLQLHPSELIEFTKESFRLLEENPQYGIVMTSLTLYPVMNTVAVRRGERPFTDNEKELSNAIVCFLHYVLHMVLNELECAMEDELPIEDGTMLPLYHQILVRCVIALQDIQDCWYVCLPDLFVGLLLRTLAVLGKVQLRLRRDEGPADYVSLRAPSVVVTHVELKTTRSRMNRTTAHVIDVTGRLIVSLHAAAAMDIKALQPVREVLTHGTNEAMAKVFCDLVSLSMANSPASQRHFLHADPLEIAAQLCLSATLAESQLSVYRMISSAAHKNPRNISIIAPVLMKQLLAMAVSPRSPAVLFAAIQCFCELAYNDPRRYEDFSDALPGRHQHLSPPAAFASAASSVSAAAAAQTSPSAFDRLMTGRQSCTHELHPGAVVFQLGHTFKLDDGAMVNLCRSCAAMHPPSGASEDREASFQYFSCQCPCCRQDAYARPLPPPTVPDTTSIRLLQSSHLWASLEKNVVAYPTSAELLNTVGYLTLHLRAPESVVRALFEALATKTDLRPFAAAALAVASHACLPGLREHLRRYGSTALVRYMTEPYVAVTPLKGVRRPGDTTGSSQVESGFGLSPSPEDASTDRTARSDFRRSSGFFLTGSSPAVNLFPSSTVGAREHADSALDAAQGI